MLTTPFPSWTRMRSAISSIGSPKNWPAPWLSSASSPRWMMPIQAGETLPYCVLNCAALSPTYSSIARRSLRSRSRSPLSSAILKTTASTPSCVSFRSSMRPRRSGPMSEMVARTGWPALPYTSQKITGQAALSAARFSCWRRASTLALAPPVFASPERSPLTSAMNTGTPIDEKRWASVCSVTLLPVPVAPVIKPWRLASAGKSSRLVLSFFATRSGAAMTLKSYYGGSQQMGEHQAPQGGGGCEEGQGVHAAHQGDHGGDEARRRGRQRESTPAPRYGQGTRRQHD